MPPNDTLNVVHACAAGLDVHKMQVTATVRRARPGAEADLATEIFSALPGGLEELASWLRSHEVSAAVMEGTGIYWEAPYRALEAAGIEPVLVHAQHVKQIKGRKTDIADSTWLARICQFGLGSPSMIPPARFRSLRKISRLRRQLVRDRARLRNRVHKVLDGAGVRVGGVLSDAFGSNGLRILKGLAAGKSADAILGSLSHEVRHHVEKLRDALSMDLEPSDRFLLRDLLDAWHRTVTRIAAYDAELQNGLSEHGDLLALLATIPGIDRGAAATILVELGPDMSVFPSHEHCAAWAGLCPGNNESAGKRRAATVRRGNTALRDVLIECAHAAVRTRGCQFQSYYRSLRARRGSKRAIVATAHKMLRVIYSVLKNRKPSRDPETDYEALMVLRNAPRWIAMLQAYGIDPLTGLPANQPDS